MAGAYLNKEEVEDLVRSFQQSLASVTNDIEQATQQIAALESEIVQMNQEKAEAEQTQEARHLEFQEAAAVRSSWPLYYAPGSQSGGGGSH